MDNTVIHAPEVPVSGLTMPNCTVTVNGVLVDVDADGAFTTTVILEEGPNLLEIIASDLSGEQRSAVLSVIYIP